MQHCQWGEGAKDGTLATDGDLAKESNCIKAGNLTMKKLCWDGYLPSPRQSTLLRLANIAKDGNCATRGACAKGGVIAKDGKLCRGLQVHHGG
jgi:hypothetical protein